MGICSQRKVLKGEIGLEKLTRTELGRFQQNPGNLGKEPRELPPPDASECGGGDGKMEMGEWR